MSFSEKLARCVAAGTRIVLRNFLHRDAANFPGKIGLVCDSSLIAHAAASLKCGSVCVVGTNGKTTTTNLLADTLECAGFSVCCNRTGANLDSGVASALLEHKNTSWAVLECDELWLVHVLPQLQSNYVVLLNLFRDQLDRSGEIELVQQSIVAALKKSPASTLIYNADDPLCAAIAQQAPNKSIAFGINEDMRLTQNLVSDSQMCQNCSSALAYEYHQYGQLGSYSCPVCGFARPPLDYAAQKITFTPNGFHFELFANALTSTEHVNMPACSVRTGAVTSTAHAAATEPATHPETPAPLMHLCAKVPGSYMVYNITALAVAATLLGCTPHAIQQAIDAFTPNNGRLERLTIGKHNVLLNLAKNPTGMNQNIRIALANKQPFALGIFINDKEADGHDISWLWDVDFQELATRTDIRVFAGGIRKNDLQVRLKYAGIPAPLIQNANDLIRASEEVLGAECPVYAIANYTALPPVKAALEKLAAETPAAATKAPHTSATPAVTSAAASSVPTIAPPAAAEPAPTPTPAATTTPAPTPTPATAAPTSDERPVIIAHLFPALLNLYGDGGNVTILKKRLEWRGIPVCVRAIDETTPFDLSDVDLVFLGGSPDREQEIAATHLAKHASELAAFIHAGGVCLAICGGYQMLGRTWLVNGESVRGLDIGAFETRRAGDAHDRLVGNIALRVEGIEHPVIGYENHAGRTYLDCDANAFGTLASKTGHGNNDSRKTDGYVQGNLIGTYLHGPVLAKNPEVADKLLRLALERWAIRYKTAAPALVPLDDTAELQANAFMTGRLQ